MDDNLVRLKLLTAPVSGFGSSNFDVLRTGPSFKLLGLEVPDAVADAFMITDLRVGKDSQLISPSCFPASFFAASSRRERLGLLGVAHNNTYLKVSLTNLCADERVFEGSFVGEVVGSHVDPRPGDGTKMRMIVGLGLTVVATGAEVVVYGAQPQLRFLPRRLAIPRAVLGTGASGAFEVVAAAVLNYRRELRQKIEGPFVTDSYSERCEGNFECPVDMEPADILAITVRNRTDSQRAFYGTVAGTVTW
jgi:hypothetical protein